MSKLSKITLIEQVLDAMDLLHKSVAHTCASEKYDITPLQLNALKYLSEQKGTTAGALGVHLHLSSSATTQLGERLVTAGLVKRQKHPTDRRAVIIATTPKGEKVCTYLLEQQKNGMGQLFGHLSEKDLEDMANIIKRLHITINKKQ